jgi:hypothetical protein
VTANPDDRTGGFAGAVIPTPALPDDDGGTPEALRTALDSHARGSGSGSALLRALAESRLFVPVVALLDSESVDAVDGMRREKQSSMASVLVDSPRYGRALLAFSGIDAMRSWREDARPVAIPAPLAARAAVGELASTLVVDVAGPTAFAVGGDELLMLAAVARAPSAQDDPVLMAAIARVLSVTTGEEATHFTLADGEGTDPALLEVEAGLKPEQQAAIAQLLSSDRVVGRLLPNGVRVRFDDTP